jgi:hypothetical protein
LCPWALGRILQFGLRLRRTRAAVGLGWMSWSQLWLRSFGLAICVGQGLRCMDMSKFSTTAKMAVNFSTRLSIFSTSGGGGMAHHGPKTTGPRPGIRTYVNRGQRKAIYGQGLRQMSKKSTRRGSAATYTRPLMRERGRSANSGGSSGPYTRLVGRGRGQRRPI